jgi:hypothetical protein
MVNKSLSNLGIRLDNFRRKAMRINNRSQEMVVDAVGCEPVSISNSLLTGKLTGNFAKSDPPLQFWRPVGGRIQWLTD